MTVPDVHVHRHVVTCRVVGARAAGDRAVRSALEGPLAACLDEAFARAGPDGYWLIRRLDVTAQVAAGWDSNEVAFSLAQELMRELARRTRDRSDPDVLWFPDRAAYLAQYLADRGAGRAGGRWQYDALRSATLLDLAESEPADLVAALVRLTPQELHGVAHDLTEDQEAALLGGLRGVDSPQLLVPAIRRLTPARLLAAPRPGLLLAITAAAGGAPLDAVAGPALAVGGLVAARRHVDWDELLDDVGLGRWAAATRLVEADHVLAFVPWDRAEREAVLRELRTTPASDTVRLHTTFGGCFVLLRVLPDLWTWAAATRTWPPLGGTPAHRVAQLLTVTAALGRGADAGAAEDHVCRLAFGCDTDLDGLAAYVSALTTAQVAAFEAVAGVQVEVDAAAETTLPSPFDGSPAADLIGRAAHAAIVAVGRSLVGMAGASPAYLWANVLDVPAWLTLDDERPVVALGSPPLGVLLSISGLNRGELDVAGEVTWTLTTRD